MVFSPLLTAPNVPKPQPFTPPASNVQYNPIMKVGGYNFSAPSQGPGLDYNSYYSNNPVTLNATPFRFTVPDVASLAAKYQTQLDPRFNALRESRTSQLRADYDMLRNKEMERLNSRGLIGSGIENQQMVNFANDQTRQLSAIDQELFGAQIKEAQDMAKAEATLRFQVQSAQAENQLNTAIAKAETMLKSGQLSVAERELLLKYLQQQIDAKNELMKRKIEYLGTKQQAPAAGTEKNPVGQELGYQLGQSFDFGSLTSGGGGDYGIGTAVNHLGTANQALRFFSPPAL